MIDDGERDTAFEIGESQTGALFGRIAVAIFDGATGGAVMPPDHAIELAQQALDHSALVHAASIAMPDRHAIFGTASLERRSVKLLRRIRHDLLWPSERGPSMRDAARFEPRFLGTNRVGEAQRHRKRARGFERQAETQNAAREHIDEDREISTADKGASAIDNLDKLDVGRRVVDLRHREWPGRADIAGPGF